jgi:hypothetical protein
MESMDWEGGVCIVQTYVVLLLFDLVADCILGSGGTSAEGGIRVFGDLCTGMSSVQGIGGGAGEYIRLLASFDAEEVAPWTDSLT